MLEYWVVLGGFACFVAKSQECAEVFCKDHLIDPYTNQPREFKVDAIESGTAGYFFRHLPERIPVEIDWETIEIGISKTQAADGNLQKDFPLLPRLERMTGINK